MASPEIVFLHIPKAAGTSQRGAFQQHYGTDKVFWYGMDTAPNIESYPRKQIGDRFVVGGHKMLSFYPRRINPLYCAILRDPIERAISLFNYYSRPELALSEKGQQARARARLRKIEQGLDPDSMLLSIRNSESFRQEISNYQCAYLSTRDCTFKDVRQSLKRVDHLIGTMRHHALFHREMSDILGWQDNPVSVVNRSQENYAAPFLEDEELVALITKLNEQDQKLMDWVEKEQGGVWLNLANAATRRQRLQRLPRQSVEPPLKRMTLEEGEKLWPLRAESRLEWPLSKMYIARHAKVIYVPIPGSADGVIKRMMLALSSVSHQDAILALGINRVTDRYVTGLVLEDHNQALIAELARSDEYFRFAVIYEPLQRLLDLFEQRFVTHRHQLPRWQALHQMVADAQQIEQADCELGISFRQFIRGCVSGRYYHRLIIRQSRYLPWPDSYDRIYRPDQLAKLAADLEVKRRVSVQLPEFEPRAALVGPALTASYADTPAGRLPAESEKWREELLDQPLLDEIKQFYDTDFKLYNRTAEINGDRVGE